ncbi:MAG: hypothetical protein JSV91_13925 [Phycisphaerales bacterium]|nr:MAG: hypothetical protein JSV91_13925 [Phycisphaerales bacterium]
MKPATLNVLAAVAFALPALNANGQSATVIEFPDPGHFYQNTTFTLDGDVGYIPSADNDVLWSFSLSAGAIIDPDGLPLPAPGTASDPYLFADNLVAIPGWFPYQGIFVADVSDPAHLEQVGVIQFSDSCNIQGQNVEIDDDGVIGYVASFPNDTLYSFNVQTMSLVDPDGLPLPGNPDRIARSGDRVAIVDTTNGDIMVADISDPAHMEFAGVIHLSGAAFGSNDNIVFADDGRTGFVSSNQRVLFSFDVLDLTLLDPDGFAFGTQLYGDDVAINGNTVACVWSRGLTFVDVSDPTDMTLIANANFGGTVAPQGSATVEFTPDGQSAAIPIIYPADLVYVFDVATGEQIAEPFPIEPQGNYLTIYDNNKIATICSGGESNNIWLIEGLLGVYGDVNGDGIVDIDDVFDILAQWGPCPRPPDDCPADVDGSGEVDIDDLFEVLANWS